MNLGSMSENGIMPTDSLRNRRSIKVQIDQTSQTTLFMSSEVFKAVSLSWGAKDTLIQDVSL